MLKTLAHRGINARLYELMVSILGFYLSFFSSPSMDKCLIRMASFSLSHQKNAMRITFPNEYMMKM